VKGVSDRFSVARDDASAAFFDAAARGTLLVRRCRVCGRYLAPHHQRCAEGDTLEWVASSGRGRLVTWAVDHGTPLDAALATPDGRGCAFGYVELDEGPWLQVAIVDADPDGLTEGAAMVVRFVRLGEGEPVPVATPA